MPTSNGRTFSAWLTINRGLVAHIRFHPAVPHICLVLADVGLFRTLRHSSRALEKVECTSPHQPRSGERMQPMAPAVRVNDNAGFSP